MPDQKGPRNIMGLEHLDPIRRLEEFQRETSKLLAELLAELPVSTASTDSVAFLPEVDLVETSFDFRLFISVPGLVEDDIEIEVEPRHLTVRGERRSPYDAAQRVTPLQEWRYGFFERQFVLEKSIDISSLKVEYDAGVLTIVARKSAVDEGKADADSDMTNAGEEGEALK